MRMARMFADFLSVLIRIHPGNFRSIRVPISSIFTLGESFPAPPPCL